ncbi:MAG: CpaF family protein [Eubacterium sp.]|nr:CpaF family protein [Eubacterium sp.]
MKYTEELERRMHGELMERLQQMEALNDDEILELIDEMLLAETGTVRMPLMTRERLRMTLFNAVRRLDVLQELVDDPSVTEIMVNGYREIFVERAGKIRRWDKCFSSEERLQDVIQQIAGQCNRVVNEQNPIVDARLQNGSRVNVVLPPVSLGGPILTIRRFSDEPVTMDMLVRWGSLTQEAAQFLGRLVGAAYSILVGGGTSTGKTTFLNALSNAIPKDERVITIEDNAELQIRGIENLVRLEVRNANIEGTNEITMRDLIKTALRMRPTRLIIGETRGAEAGDWLTCLNTGHDGSLGTAHANSVRDMIGRLEMMVLSGIELPIPVIRRQIASGIEIMVHLTRDRNGKRQVDEIAEVTGMSGDEVQIHTLYKRTAAGILEKRGELQNREKWEKAYGEEEA